MIIQTIDSVIAIEVIAKTTCKRRLAAIGFLGSGHGCRRGAAARPGGRPAGREAPRLSV